MSTYPFFSIIVINLNNAEGLQSTLASVKSQTLDDFEVICVDGGSTDDSHQVKNTYNDIISCHIVGQDSGIYNAMNLGVKKAQGSYVLFLNSGDKLNESDILFHVYEKASLMQETLLFGYASITSGKDSWLFPSERFTTDKNSLDYWLSMREPNHQAMFFPMQFCKNCFYDESLKIIADKKFKRAALSHLEYCFLDITISAFELGGTSNKIRDLSHVMTYIKDYQNYYLQTDFSWRNIFLFFTSSTKIFIKYLAQAISEQNFWNIIKIMRNHPIA